VFFVLTDMSEYSNTKSVKGSRSAMKKSGRNDPCPCGSGRKFKKCHSGREDEIPVSRAPDLSIEEMGSKISTLRPVEYGKARAMADQLDIPGLTGKHIGIRYVDLKEYVRLGLLGSDHQEAETGRGGGIFVNPYKTKKADPDNLYVAISPDIDDSTLIHQLAHVLTYLGETGKPAGTLDAMGLEVGIPVGHLEHPDEFGYWLDHLQKKFNGALDAEDAIILFLYQNGQLIKTAEIAEGNGTVLWTKSERIFRFLSQHSEEIDRMIKLRAGYIGPMKSGPWG
jgi:hypothetical protein